MKTFSFAKRMKSMLMVDFKRMHKSKFFYILLACAFLIPILMTVMMTMMDGSVSVNPQTGVETVVHGPENAWQSIGTPVLNEETGDDINGNASAEAMGGMDVMSMCNINMMFMLVAVFVCLFISGDFRSGYAKNLFTVRAKKGDYIISKTLTGFVCGVLMLVLYLMGAMLGGVISGLSFDIGVLTVSNIIMCMISKIFIMMLFVAIDVLVSVAAKQKTWLCLCGSLGAGMLFFMMVGLITPLESTVINVCLCFAGGMLSAVIFGIAGKKVLNKTSLC